MNRRIDTNRDILPSPSAPGAALPRGNNAWVNGSFFLVAAATLVALFAWVSNLVEWYALPLVLIGGLLMVGVIGGLQLRNDEKLSQTNFVTLMVETYKRLPLLRRHQ